jgi:hypothetical protein
MQALRDDDAPPGRTLDANLLVTDDVAGGHEHWFLSHPLRRIRGVPPPNVQTHNARAGETTDCWRRWPDANLRG